MSFSVSSRPLCFSIAGWRFAAPLWAWLLLLFGMAVFWQLAEWQLGRAKEKETMLLRYEARLHDAPMPLSALNENLQVGQDVADMPLHLSGHYDNTRNILLDNQMNGAVAGYHILTAFLPDDGGPALLVNRGWVPADRDRNVLPGIPPAAANEIAGSVAWPSDMFVVGKEDYATRPLRLLRLDVPAASGALGIPLLPVVLRLSPSAADGFRREWSPHDRIRMGPEQHRAYAFQWFSLMAAVVVTFLAVNFRKVVSRVADETEEKSQ